jgi:branched-chain amino acid transport system permease protein
MAATSSLSNREARIAARRPSGAAVWRGVLQTTLIASAIAVLLALSGVFASFADRDVIADALSLNTVVLALILFASAYAAGARAARQQAEPLVPAVAAAAGVALALALVTWVESVVDLRFVFANLTTPIADVLAFGQPLTLGLPFLVGIGAAVGLLAGLSFHIAPRVRRALFTAFALTVILGLLENQIRQVMALSDALAVAAAFGLGYAVVRARGLTPLVPRVLVGAAVGAAVGVVGLLLSATGLFAEGSFLVGRGDVPLLLGLAGTAPWVVPGIFAAIGAAGALAAAHRTGVHNALVLIVVGVLIIGILNAAGAMTLVTAVLMFALLAAAFLLLPALSAQGEGAFTTMSEGAQAAASRAALVFIAVFLLVLPAFTGQYITNVMNGVGLYIIMGIGLNIVVGYAGLLDLGYVAFFAIGAYTVGLLTTPSMLTCGGLPPDAITRETVAQLCPNILNFWAAWPIAIVVSGLAGVSLGIPILRLRGDYLAIVTLGFGEIIRIIIKFDDFKPLFGAAQGIANIPRPVLDLTAFNPAWRFELTGEIGIYYLTLAAITVIGVIGAGVVTSRLGRAWLAMRADEDVAQAMGVNLTRTKLTAFALGASFAGMGGALSAIRLYGAYPDSFTVLVSINVLSLIIIGGLGSIPGVLVGAFVLVGLPEVLRELSDYRLLAFGVLLVAAMILKPEGIIPPAVRRLSERVRGKAQNEPQGNRP